MIARLSHCIRKSICDLPLMGTAFEWISLKKNMKKLLLFFLFWSEKGFSKGALFTFFFFLLIIFLIIHLSVNIVISHIFYDFLYTFFICFTYKKSKLPKYKFKNRTSKKVLLNKVEINNVKWRGWEVTRRHSKNKLAFIAWSLHIHNLWSITRNTVEFQT